MEQRKCKWEDIAVIGMYLDKLSMLAKGKYFSTCNLNAVLDCLREAEQCLAGIPVVGEDDKPMIPQCPDGTSHEDCFCMPR